MNWRDYTAIGGAVVAMVAAFSGGYLSARNHYLAQIAEEREAAAVALANQGRKSYEKLVAAQDALDAARADGERMSRDYAERLRKLGKDRVRKTSVAACRDERAAVARCEGLLRESVELLGEGREILCRNAAVHDATLISG